MENIVTEEMKFCSIDLQKLYDEGSLIPEITSKTFRKWILTHNPASPNDFRTDFDSHRKLQLIYATMELNNPHPDHPGRLQSRVEWIFKELEMLMKSIDKAPPPMWYLTPFLEQKLITFNPYERYMWTQFQVLLMIFIEKYRSKENNMII